MTASQISIPTAEQQLLSKEAIKLPPRQRLQLLLNAEKYPIVKKGTSAESQIREMIDFYHFCCLMLTQYFPNEKAEYNCLMLSLMASQETIPSIATSQLSKAYELLGNYEELERTINRIRMLFFEYEHAFPQLYEEYNLEDLATVHIVDLIHDTRDLISMKPELVTKILTRWDLLS